MEMRVYEGPSTYEVTIPVDTLYKFAKTWPSHNFDLDAEYVIEFDKNSGDLVDFTKFIDKKHVSMNDNEDGPEFAALAEDACRFGAKELSLDSVFHIRYGESLPPVPQF